MAVPPLARFSLENPPISRAAHRRTDEVWLREAWRKARVVVVDDGGRAAVEDGALVLVDPDGEPGMFLGEDADGMPYFAAFGEVSDGVTLREAGHLLSERDLGLFTAATALANWHRSHRHSPATGVETTVGEAGWVRLPADGGTPLWPRTDPAVIVLVHDGVAGPEGQVLLGRKAEWPANRYSCFAGFVEPGESAEAAVVREVAEEVGVAVSRLAYVGSQPWPFPGQLMLAFTALADPSLPVHRTDEELEDARWYSRRAFAEGTGPKLPPPVSIAHFMISSWLKP